MGKLLPILQDVQSNDRDRNASPLRVLNIVSTDMWVSSQLRSPFTLGVDSTTGHLLSTAFCQNLRSLTISRANNKTRQDWVAFSKAIASLPHLSTLELCDASDYCGATTTTENEQERVDTSAERVDISVLLEALSTTFQDTKRPLETLKLHFNAYQPGQFSLRSWLKFWAMHHGTLRELSLHMIQIAGCGKRTSSSDKRIFSQKDLPMETLQLTFIDFDSHETWRSFFLECLLRSSSHGTNQRPDNITIQSRLQTLVLVNPSWTTLQYHLLWTRLFHPTPSSQNEFCRLQSLSTSVWTAYDILYLKKPLWEGKSDLCCVKRIIQKAMEPTIPHILSGWRAHPPSRNFKQFLFPQDGDRRISHENWKTLEEIWNLYRTIANLQCKEERSSQSTESVLELLCSRQLHKTTSSDSDIPSLDGVFHFMTYFGPTTLCT